MGKIAEQLESVFFDFYKELRCIYEEEHAICLTNEAWNEYLNDYMNNDVCSYIAAIIIAKGIYTKLGFEVVATIEGKRKKYKMMKSNSAIN